MNGLYPEESKKLDVIGHLEELRRRILVCLAVLVSATFLMFWRGRDLMAIVKRPLGVLAHDLVFIAPTEAFTAYVQVAFLAGLVLSFPVLLCQMWAFFRAAVPRPVRRGAVLWVVSALFLFVLGILFSYFVAIPAALKFLIGFGSEIARPWITLGRYVSFFTAFLLIGGITFQIPVLVGFLTDTGVLSPEVMKRTRPYALIIILILAAVITPTQDVFNLLIFAVPMMLLYEAGIWITVLRNK